MRYFNKSWRRALGQPRRIWRIGPTQAGREGGEVESPGFNLIEKQEHIELAARALKAIAHPLRLKILCVVGDQEACVQEIVDAVGTSQSNISQHLAILREKGVLLTRKDANRVYYRVGDARTLQLIGMMREVFCGVTAS